ncbi:MAG: GNAT family N-acetyltransferase [Bacteroides sp.]|nr:GNAT family N-acetyltransferase [Bacteroides sp.]
MEKFSLKEATREDIPLITALADRVWYETYHEIHTRSQLEYMFEQMYSPEKLAKDMENGQVYFIGYQEKDPIGYVAIEQKENSLFYLQKLYVMPETQGTGAGSFLFAAVIRFIRSIHPGKCLLELNVNRKNRAIGFYQKKGMSIYKESNDYIGEGFYMNNCFMRMEL